MMDENKLWELAQSVERTAVNQKHILKLLDHLDARMREVEKQDDREEERMAQMQDSVANLIEVVQKVEEASQRMRRIAFGFLALLGILAVLGWDILPKALKADVLTLI